MAEQLVRLVELIADGGREAETVKRQWELTVHAVEATWQRGSVYVDNALATEDTAGGVTRMRTAYSEIEVAVITNRTELEAAIRAGSTDRATRLAEDLGRALQDQLDLVVSGARAYLDALGSMQD